MERVLEVSNLTSFSVERGHALAIPGPNASGKAVLFRALIRAIPFDDSVRWAAGARIGYVPQKPAMRTNEILNCPPDVCRIVAAC